MEEEKQMKRRLIGGSIVLLAIAALIVAQGERLASPAGVASTEIRGKYVPGPDGPVYQDGKWIEMEIERANVIMKFKFQLKSML